MLSYQVFLSMRESLLFIQEYYIIFVEVNRKTIYEFSFWDGLSAKLVNTHSHTHAHTRFNRLAGCYENVFHA